MQSVLITTKVVSSWFSPGTPASSTTKTGCHDIAEILLKVALKHQKSLNQSLSFWGRRETGSYYGKNIKTVMVNNSTNINKTKNHFSPQTTEHKKDHDI
jgi:hypothetical protein